MAPTRPTPGGSSANPIDLTAARPATATIAGSGTDTGTGIVSGPADGSIPGTAIITGMVNNPGPVPGISGISTLFNSAPPTALDLTIDRILNQGPAGITAPAAAGGVLSGRVTKTTPKKATPKKATPKKATPKKATPKKPTAAAPNSPTPTSAADTPNPPKRGKASGLPSCIPCRRSKARCDRVVACERCIKAGKECVSGEDAAAPGGSEGAGGGGGGAGGKAGKACERCRRMKAGCVRKETCVRCEKKGQECVMA
ncbi:hypothetical protein F5144DRAFT_602038 [Chaetomium tenue]|uniref:Uncharacterized protein n=1 Tax=Chaetomium tenue TaxID=1854479 RepID=A0ACB7P7T6_9PEZI|nr:hypothetical protein F5144DRAFT_602038 [Chaetomium globosum]